MWAAAAPTANGRVDCRLQQRHEDLRRAARRDAIKNVRNPDRPLGGAAGMLLKPAAAKWPPSVRVFPEPIADAANQRPSSHAADVRQLYAVRSRGGSPSESNMVQRGHQIPFITYII